MSIEQEALAFRTQVLDLFYKLSTRHETDNYPHALLGDFKRNPLENYNTQSHIQYLELFFQEYPQFYQTYNWIEPGRSQQLFLQLMLYRLLGFPHVKLMSNTPAFHRSFKATERYPSKLVASDKRNGRGQQLKVYDFNYEKHPLHYMGYSDCIAHTFLLDQYHYRREQKEVRPEEGDVVYDLGAYLGDTMLKFAVQVGETGQVHSYDFLPSHLDVMRQNKSINPTLSERIFIHPHGVGEETKNIDRDSGSGGHRVFPGASLLNFDIDAQKIPVVSLDERVQSGALPPPNFIKMDIEGFEAPALRGASEIIRQYKPKLAISLYHKPEDFYELPKIMKELVPEYKFYLDHYTIFEADTVLYAQV